MLSKKVREFMKSQTDFEDLPLYAFPGGYPIYYVDDQNCLLCPNCATKDAGDPYRAIVDYDVNYEDDGMTCDECSEKIESAYGEIVSLSDAKTFICLEDLYGNMEDRKDY